MKGENSLYSFTEGTLTQDGQECPIEGFRVEFSTPWGLMTTLKEAVSRCAALDMDATLIIQPIVVVFDKAGRSEPIIRGR